MLFRSTGVFGAINALGTFSISAYSSAVGTGIYGQNTGAGNGVFGDVLGGVGVRGQATTGVASFGIATGAGGIGGYFRETDANGNGLLGAGNNLIGTTLAGGLGGSFIGNATGGVGWGDAATGTGIVGVGNGSGTATTLVGGSGGAFKGTDVGTYTLATTAASGTGICAPGNN